MKKCILTPIFKTKKQELLFLKCCLNSMKKYSNTDLDIKILQKRGKLC